MPGSVRTAWLLALALALGACSSSQAPPPASTASAPAAAPAPAPAQNDAAAQKELELYRKLQVEKAFELAGPIGKEIVAKYPQSSAAKEVQETLDATVAKADLIATRRRLQGLWSYQSGKESGGSQNTASIYSKDSGNGDRVRLILRRHSAWGQSAYLFGSGKGFECGSGCTLGMRFDDQPVRKLKAYLPETGEPAIFISDDKAFIDKMSAAQSVGIDVVEKGKGPRTLVFETGGFDASRFPPLAKSAPAPAKKK